MKKYMFYILQNTKYLISVYINFILSFLVVFIILNIVSSRKSTPSFELPTKLVISRYTYTELSCETR